MSASPDVSPARLPFPAAGPSRLGGRRGADRLVTRVAIASGAACLFSVSVLVAGHVLNAYSQRVQLAGSMLVLSFAMVGLLILGFASRELIHWRRSVRGLARLMNEIRAGETPMAGLDDTGGGARALVEPIRAILLDLREQKRTNAALHEEMRSRILSRTDALERQLGTLKTQASRDPMTGLGNRRAFDAMSGQIFAACLESHEDLCALMIDVDNFKPLNDTLGHAAGDELLKSIGEIVRSSIREHDTAYRVGGDEFVILLPRASRAIGERLAARLSSLVDHLARPLKLAHPPGLSIGAAALSDEKLADAKALIDLADRRLYAVKQAKPGRQRRSVA